jgi:anti-anti-sigma factor
MNISVEKNDLQTSVALAGDINIYSAAELKNELLSCVAESSNLEIDLSEVNEFDSAGLQILILAKREAKRVECELKMKAHSQSVLQLFELYDVAAFFGDPLLIPTETNLDQISERKNV